MKIIFGASDLMDIDTPQAQQSINALNSPEPNVERFLKQLADSGSKGTLVAFSQFERLR